MFHDGAHLTQQIPSSELFAMNLASGTELAECSPPCCSPLRSFVVCILDNLILPKAGVLRLSTVLVLSLFHGMSLQRRIYK